jgi:hypothetical protein
MIKRMIPNGKQSATFFIIGLLVFSALFGASLGFIYMNTSHSGNNFQNSNENTNLNSNYNNPWDSASTRGSARLDPDVGIIGISDIDAENFIDHYPGKVVHFNITLYNFGTTDLYTPFDVIMTISDGTTANPGYHYFDNRTFPEVIGKSFLKGEQKFNLSWNWTPPLSMPHGSQKNFSVSDIQFKVCFTTLLEGDKNSNNNQMCIMVKVEQPDFDIEMKKGHYGPNGKLFPSQTTYIQNAELDFFFTPKPGQANQFELNFTLYNYGEATYINYTISAPPDWKVIPPARQFWQSRANSSSPSMNLTITVFPSVKLQFLPTATPLHITLTAIAESYPLAFDTVVFKGQTAFVPTPSIIQPSLPEGMEVYYIQPGWAYIDYKVRNLGNGEDNYETWAMVGEPNIPSNFPALGWKAVVHSGRYTRILERGESQVISVKVYVPSTVRAGSPCPITLFARSVKDPFHRDGERNSTFYIFADLFRDVSFDDDNPKTIPMYPNSEASKILKIRNTGNKQDRSIRVNITSVPEDWDVIIDSSDIPPGGLARNGTAEIEVIIKTPKYVVESIYYIRIAAISENQIGGEIALPVQILKVRNIAVSSKNFKKTGNVSEKITYLLTVENRGNSKDSVNLRSIFITRDMKDMGWKVTLSKNFTTLYPYESRDVIVSVFIPLEALADTDFLTPSLDGYKILIRGISENDTSVIAEKEIEVVVNPIYDFHFNKQDDRKYLILHHTQSVYYSFSVTNNGNDRDTYSILANSPQQDNLDWITIPFVERKLLPGVTEKMFIELNPPSTLGVGEYIFNIQATSLQDPKLIQTLNLTIEIIDFDLTLTEIKVGEESLSQAGIKEGETVLLRVKIENVGDLDFYNKTIEKLVGKQEDLSLIISFTEGSNYIGEVNISYLPSIASGQNNSVWVGLPWKIGKARDYDVAVVADPKEKIPESRTTNNKISGLLKVKSDEQKEEDGPGDDEGDITLILILIVVFIIIMLIGIWMTVNLSKKQKKKGYTVDGEYKPYEETDKAEFDKDDEEEEPEGGVLGVHDERPYGKKKDKFVSDLASMITMKPIRRTKPIRRSKPLPGMPGAGVPGLERPKVAGYLPPKPKDKDDGDSTIASETGNADSSTAGTVGDDTVKK